MQINGKEYEIDQDELRLLIERDSPADWVAEDLLNAADVEVRESTQSGATSDVSV